MSSKMKITKDTGGLKSSLSKITRDLKKKDVKIGIFGKDDSKILMIARVHEFGVSIDVTPAMRGYLHSVGIHLNPSTSTVEIPERSYMRSGFDKYKKKWGKHIEKLFPLVLQKRLSVNEFYREIGQYISSQLQEHLKKLSDPPLHPKTVENTGRSNPLVHRGNLLDSITYEIE